MRGVRRAWDLVPAAAFSATLAVAALVTSLAVDRVRALAALRPDVEAGEQPPDGDHYLANDIGGHVDHHVIYFGLDGEVQARLRAAEVLFLGNSRIMFALRPEELRPYFATRGVPYYVMGFGFREADRFPMTILRKYDLRPRIVVVNADGFFGGGLSPWAGLVLRDSWFAARKRQLEAEAAHDARRRLHVLFPYWPRFFGLPGLGQARTFTAYRSRFDGTWDIWPWPAASQAFRPAPLDGPGVGRGEARDADNFKAEVEARGGRLILTRVPAPDPMPGAGPAELADRLGVPLITVDIPGPTSHDGGHLDAASARDWTRGFLAAFTPYLDDATRPR